MHQICQDDINLTEISKPKSPAQLAVLGDLHGSSLKLLHFLIEEIAETTEKSYQDYVEAYLKSELTSIKLELRAERTEKLLLLGDELADRGAHDALTLDLFAWLHQQNINFSILFSNHGLFFFEVIQKLKSICASPNDFEQEIRSLREMVIKEIDRECGQAHSLLSFLSLPQKKMLPYIETYEQSYYPHLKLLEYTTDTDGTLYIFSHAPIDFSVVEFLAKAYQVWPDSVKAMKQMTRVMCEQLIEDINHAFKRTLSDLDFKLLNEMIRCIEDQKRKPRARHKLIHYGLAKLSWNRHYGAFLKRRHRLKDAELVYVHGHDSSTEHFDKKQAQRYQTHFINLDNELGKGMTRAELKGQGIVLRFMQTQTHHRSWPASLFAHFR